MENDFFDFTESFTLPRISKLQRNQTESKFLKTKMFMRIIWSKLIKGIWIRQIQSQLSFDRILPNFYIYHKWDI